ncbi:MAG: hypothetical protein H6564_20930 [Lewinellaceae bacterium]|nr:hypothetical protein [Lewinellaceae bacterium]
MMVPLPESTTGSFAFVSTHKEKVILANDILGFYPVYYQCTEINLNSYTIVSNAILAFPVISKVKLDYVGIFQRRFTEHNFTYGSRTILSGVKRLLPGEFQQISLDGNPDLSLFDDTLYKNFSLDIKSKSLSDIAIDYFKFLKKEYQIALQDYDSLVVGISGGMDSRLMASALPQKIRKLVVTYGTNTNEYEVKIAKEVTKKLGNVSFNFYDVSNAHFPKYPTLEVLTKATESIYVNHWLPVIAHPPSTHKQPFLLGDMCEVIPGKFIGNYLTRKDKIKTYFSGGKLNLATDISVPKWKENLVSNIVSKLPKEETIYIWGCTYDHLIGETIKDIDNLFSIIEKHKPPYLELYDELFRWFTYIRITHAKQFLIHKNNYLPISPSLSFRNLRKATAILPSQRVNYNLMNCIFKEVRSLKRFQSLPTAQIPFLPFYTPKFLKLIFWGIRSTIDQMLIRRMMRKHNPYLRYRLVKSLNWPLIYQQKDALENINSYIYEDNIYIGDLPSQYLKIKNLQSYH